MTYYTKSKTSRYHASRISDVRGIVLQNFFPLKEMYYLFIHNVGQSSIILQFELRGREYVYKISIVNLSFSYAPDV